MHHGQVHGQAAAVTALGGRLYAAGTPQGVSASADGGRTWTQLGGGLGESVPGQVVVRDDRLWAATSGGLYRFPLAPPAPASTAWWAALAVLGVGLSVLAVAVGAAGGGRGRGVQR